MPNVRDALNKARDIKAALSNELNASEKQHFLTQVDQPEKQQELREFKLAKDVAANYKEHLGNIAMVEGINAAAGNSMVALSKDEKKRLEGVINRMEKTMSDMLKANPLIEKETKYAEKHDLIKPEGQGLADPAPAVAPAAQEVPPAGWKASSTGAALGPRPAAGAGGKGVSFGGHR